MLSVNATEHVEKIGSGDGIADVTGTLATARDLLERRSCEP
jgi:hypothetical protein